jgi:iron complex outermembrane receptor protein
LTELDAITKVSLRHYCKTQLDGEKPSGAGRIDRANYTDPTKIMHIPSRTFCFGRVALKAILCASNLIFASYMYAQSNSSSPSAGVVSPIALSPFTVVEQTGSGYDDQQTLIGSRTAKDLLNLPVAVSIINREMLNDLGATQLPQAITFGAPGISSNVITGFNIRGFRTGQPMRDGVAIRNLKGNTMYDIERVEIIKGPAAMLTGVNDTLGGAVNLVTRKPTAQSTGEIRLTVAENNYFRGEANASGPLRQGDSFDLMYRLTVGGTTADREKEIESLDEKFIGGAFLLYFGKEKSTSLNINWFVFNDDSYKYYHDFLDLTSTKFAKLNPLSTEKFSPARSKDVFYNTNEAYFNAELLTRVTDNSNLRVLYTHADADSTSRLIRGITIQADNYTLSRQDIPLDIIQFSHTLQVDYLYKWKRSGFTSDFSVGGDARRQSQGQDLLVLAPPAIDTRNPDFSIDDIALTPVDQLPPFTSSSRSKSDTISYYVQNNVSFWDDRIAIVGGLRWIDSNSWGQNLVSGARSETKNPRFRTHKYGILFKLLPSVTVYYTNAENVFLQSGFTNEEIPQLRKNQDGILDEIGVKVNHSLSEKYRVFGAVTYFDMALTNVEVITGEFNSRGELIKRQSAQNTSKGWEVDLGVAADVGGGRFDSKITYYNADTIDAATNRPAQNAVGESYGLLAKYTWVRGSLEGLMLGGAMYDQDAKIWGSYLVDFPTTYNAFVAYKFNASWGIQLNVENVADKRYVNSLAANGLAYAADGRSIRLQAKYLW